MLFYREFVSKQKNKTTPQVSVQCGQDWVPWVGLPTGQQPCQGTEKVPAHGAELGGKPLTVVLDDFGLLLVAVLLDTVDLYRHLGIHNGVLAFVHLWQLLARDYLGGKQGRRSGHH